MAIISKTLLATLLMCLLLLHFVHSFDVMVDNSTDGSGRSFLQKIDCGARCSERCKLSSRPNLCHRACGTCCNRCNCVPPGTSGNYDACPCYANMTTHGGRHKCP